MALHAAQKREKDRPFARAASAVLALFGKVPVLRSVLGPLYKNPRLNMAERHRLENEALGRRYEWENKNLERREKALERVDARERRSLARDQRRMDEHKKQQRMRDSATRRMQIGENKADITSAAAAAAAAKQTQKRTQGAGQRRPRGYGYRRD